MKYYILILSHWLLYLEISYAKDAKAKSPVILVPGDGGSQIWANLTGKPSTVHWFCEKHTSKPYLLWLSFEQMFPVIQADCLVDNLKLLYNTTTHKTSNNHGVDIMIPGWGHTWSVENIDTSALTHGVTYYYGALVEALVKDLGYERGVSVRGAPFDFRKPPTELGHFFQQLATLIEDTYMLNNRSRVTLVTHSYGAPAIVYFLNRMAQDWKDTFINSFVSIGGPWGGAVKSILALTTGYDLDIYPLEPWSQKFRTLQRTLPSTILLLPHSTYWNKSSIIASRPGKNYTIGNYEEFFKDIGHPMGYQIYKDNDHILANISAPNVDVHCLYGSGLPTPSTYKWNWKFLFPDWAPSVVSGPGDGTVNEVSLQGCRKWKGSGKHSVKEQAFPDREHRSMIKDKDVIEYIKKIV